MIPVPTAAAALLLAATGAAAGEPLTVDDCVALALRHSAQIDEAEAKVEFYEGVLAEVEANYYPKLNALAFVAPMFTVTGNTVEFDRRWKSLRHWGPYTHLEALLAQPLYTFGRVEAGETAARERTAVERARVRETELTVALEVRRLYYLHLYARSMLPALKNGVEGLTEALERGRELYDEGDGEITLIDVNKLAYGLATVTRLRLEAVAGAGLALSALKHTIGLPESHDLVLADKRMPRLDDYELEPLRESLAAAAEHRPEWKQIEHGKKAAAALEDAELLAMAPVLFVAGQFRWAWTPTRDNQDNPYAWDPFNELFGGIAVGLQLNLDPAAALARADQAVALGHEVEALARFAATGIPLRVRKAHDEVTRFRESATLARDGVKAAQKWMTFAGTAYMTGTGEAKDLLEGLVAWLQAKEAYYATLRDYFLARADLDFAIGR